MLITPKGKVIANTVSTAFPWAIRGAVAGVLEGPTSTVAAASSTLYPGDLCTIRIPDHIATEVIHRTCTRFRGRIRTTRTVVGDTTISRTATALICFLCTGRIPLVETTARALRADAIGDRKVVATLAAIGNAARAFTISTIDWTGIAPFCGSTDRIPATISGTILGARTRILTQIARAIAATSQTLTARQIRAGLIPQRQTTERIKPADAAFRYAVVAAWIVVGFTTLS